MPRPHGWRRRVERLLGGSAQCIRQAAGNSERQRTDNKRRVGFLTIEKQQMPIALKSCGTKGRRTISQAANPRGMRASVQGVPKMCPLFETVGHSSLHAS